MAGILERLDGVLFKRIHRSHIVNLDHVSKLLPWFGGDSLVMMADGSRLTLSRNHRDALKGF
jgi:two-component system LytT family response regulator